MQLALPKEIVIFDTEYTTWEGAPARNWGGEGEHRELVQIGAIKVNTERLQEIDTFEAFVRPRINPILSDFFVKFTGISQQIVDTKGADFVEVWDRFEVWRKKDPAYSFGNDIVVIKENCDLTGIHLWTADEFFNVCDVFDRHGIQTEDYHSSTIVSAFGVVPRDGAHNALNDARSILDALILLQEHLQKQN